VYRALAGKTLCRTNKTNTLSPVVLDGFFILIYSIDAGQNGVSKLLDS